MTERAHVVTYTRTPDEWSVTWECPCEKSSWQNPCDCVFPDPSSVAALARDDQRRRRAEREPTP